MATINIDNIGAKVLEVLRTEAYSFEYTWRPLYSSAPRVLGGKTGPGNFSIGRGGVLLFDAPKRPARRDVRNAASGCRIAVFNRDGIELVSTLFPSAECPAWHADNFVETAHPSAANALQRLGLEADTELPVSYAFADGSEVIIYQNQINVIDPEGQRLYEQRYDAPSRAEGLLSSIEAALALPYERTDTQWLTSLLAQGGAIEDRGATFYPPGNPKLYACTVDSSRLLVRMPSRLEEGFVEVLFGGTGAYSKRLRLPRLVTPSQAHEALETLERPINGLAFERMWTAQLPRVRLSHSLQGNEVLTYADRSTLVRGAKTVFAVSGSRPDVSAELPPALHWCQAECLVRKLQMSGSITDATIEKMIKAAGADMKERFATYTLPDESQVCWRRATLEHAGAVEACGGTGSLFIKRSCALPILNSQAHAALAKLGSPIVSGLVTVVALSAALKNASLEVNVSSGNDVYTYADGSKLIRESRALRAQCAGVPDVSAALPHHMHRPSRAPYKCHAERVIDKIGILQPCARRLESIGEAMAEVGIFTDEPGKLRPSVWVSTFDGSRVELFNNDDGSHLVQARGGVTGKVLCSVTIDPVPRAVPEASTPLQTLLNSVQRAIDSQPWPISATAPLEVSVTKAEPVPLETTITMASGKTLDCKCHEREPKAAEPSQAAQVIAQIRKDLTVDTADILARLSDSVVAECSAGCYHTRDAMWITFRDGSRARWIYATAEQGGSFTEISPGSASQALPARCTAFRLVKGLMPPYNGGDIRRTLQSSSSAVTEYGDESGSHFAFPDGSSAIWMYSDRARAGTLTAYARSGERFNIDLPRIVPTARHPGTPASRAVGSVKGTYEFSVDFKPTVADAIVDIVAHHEHTSEKHIRHVIDVHKGDRTYSLSDKKGFRREYMFPDGSALTWWLKLEPGANVEGFTDPFLRVNGGRAHIWRGK